MVMTADGATIYVGTAAGSSGIIAVDRVTGDRTTVSSDSVGAGTPVDFVLSLLLHDSDLYAVLGDKVLHVDPSTGDRTVVTDAFGVGAGPYPGLRSAVIDPTGATIYALGPGDSIAIDVASGDRTVFSSPLGDGPWYLPARAGIDGQGIIWILDPELHAVMALDPTTGERVIASK